MKKLLIILILCCQLPLYSEQVEYYDMEFVNKIQSLKFQLDSLIELKKLEIDSLNFQMGKLKVKKERKIRQLEQEIIELKKKLRACHLANRNLENNLDNQKDKLKKRKSELVRSNQDNEQLQNDNTTLQSEKARAKRKEDKLKALVRKLSRHIKAEKARKERIYNQYKNLQENISAFIRPPDGEANIVRKGDHLRLVINLNGAVNFKPRSAKLGKRSKRILDSIFKIITKYPGYHISIEGHTDNVPFHTRYIKNNWELSVKRAVTVLEYGLAKNPHLDPKQVSASGYGEFHPIDTNSTNAGKARNRRVDIIVVYW